MILRVRHSDEHDNLQDLALDRFCAIGMGRHSGCMGAKEAAKTDKVVLRVRTGDGGSR